MSSGRILIALAVGFFLAVSSTPGREARPAQDSEQEEKAVLDLFSALTRAEDPKKRQDLIDRIVAQGSVASRALTRHLVELSDRDEESLQAVLGELRSVAVPRLGNVLADGPEDAARVAARCLGEIGGEEAASILLQQLPGSSGERERALLAALGEAGDPRALPVLQEAAGPERLPETRTVAIAALGELARLESAAVLMGLLEDANHHVRQHAAKALSQLGPPVIPILESRLDEASERGRALLVVVAGRVSGERALPFLLARLDDPSWVVRLHAVEALARRNTPAALEALAARLEQEEDPLVRARLRALVE